GNAPREELGQALHDHRLDPERIPSPYTCLVVNTGAHLVLLDTGAGPFAPGVGRLLQRLRAKGIAPEEIDTVVITHGHPDHIGGNTDEAGQLIFPDARYVMWRDEWDFWTDEVSLAQMPQVFASFARKNLPPLRG